jgi:hypothetical protein
MKYKKTIIRKITTLQSLVTIWKLRLKSKNDIFSTVEKKNRYNRLNWHFFTIFVGCNFTEKR